MPQKTSTDDSSASEIAVGDDIPVANCADGSDRKIDCLRKAQGREARLPT
jgi:hypothetical protein